MIALAKFQETRRLLALGNLSQRRIARIVGISRATVNAIARGNYHDRESREAARLREQPVFEGPLARCPGCGGMVLMPCLACRVQQLKDREQAILRAARRKLREDATRQLIEAVRRAYWEREAQASEAESAANYSPPAAAAGSGSADCK